MKTYKKYIQPVTMLHDFLSSGEVMGIGIGDGSTPDQFGKGSQDIDDTIDADDADYRESVWDE
ncbi:MAG: hypothetical protein IJK42_13185 [Prevotella sp.]|nr:hypothetical protein [Prevotella sp.]MBQ6210701.1 hypothetical protein [Prevotella sp.]